LKSLKFFNGSPGKTPFGSAQGKLTFIVMAHWQ
jgi:hypothetical protein